MSNRLREAIEQELGGSSRQALTEAREELTGRYRDGHKKSFMTTEAHRYAYLATRMPATYAVVQRVLQEVSLRGEEVTSLLDLGAGPGTVLWAASSLFPHLTKACLIERDADLAKLGRKLMKHAAFPIAVEWSIQDMREQTSLPSYDLITLSYAIGELAEEEREGVVKKCFEATARYLAIIEPGTPQGFERIRAIRQQLIKLGAHMLAPCPHTFTCPMADGDWCHFGERVERSSLHRQLKGGSLGYEDEKYSYVVVSKHPCHVTSGRVLREPLRRSGHIHLYLCTLKGLEPRVVSRKEGELYKLARKVEWGDG